MTANKLDNRAQHLHIVRLADIKGTKHVHSQDHIIVVDTDSVSLVQVIDISLCVFRYGEEYLAMILGDEDTAVCWIVESA